MPRPLLKTWAMRASDRSFTPMEPPKQPPLDGSIPALPGFVDFHAAHNPSRRWALLAPESGSEVKPITFLEFADATHRIAHLLRPDPSEAKGEVVALLIHCDTILYLALMVGLIRAGFTVSLLKFAMPYMP